MNVEKKFIVYRYIDPQTGVERHGETMRELLERINEYVLNSQNLETKPNGPFHQLINERMNLTNNKNKFTTAEERFNAFLKQFSIEIWICDSKVEMDALELFNTLYYNRAEFSNYENRERAAILSNLDVNGRANGVYGNSVWNKARIDNAWDIIDCLEQSLSEDEMLKQFGLKDADYLSREYIRQYFNGENEYMIEGEPVNLDARIEGSGRVDTQSYRYIEALRQYTLKVARKTSEGNRMKDVEYCSDNKISDEQQGDLIWTVEGPQGQLIGLFYGLYGNGLSQSYYNNLDGFKSWFRAEDNAELQNPDFRPSMKDISDKVYKVLNKQNYRQIAENEYEYYFVNKYGGIFRFSIMLINNRIDKIIPIVDEE